MSSTYGENLKITVFGQSHSPAIGVCIDGLPAGIEIDMERLCAFMQRRAPGNDPTATARKEGDVPRFLSGLVGNVTCGAPLVCIIENTNIKSSDYDELRDCPRPGHGDYAAYIKYNGKNDVSGGGHFSGRLTAPMCIAGGIALQMLEKKGISIGAHIVQIGKERCECWKGECVSPEDMKILETFPVCTHGDEERLRGEIMAAKAEGDSVGGIIECCAIGVPAGLGDGIFDGMEGRIARFVFSIPAVKGVEFGAGMRCAEMRGSENNDAFGIKDGAVVMKTNNAGGILGGITCGAPIIFRAAMKPTPSIAKEQDSVSLSRMEEKKLSVRGRHDPCIVARAVPVMESAMALAILDAWMECTSEEI